MRNQISKFKLVQLCIPVVFLLNCLNFPNRADNSELAKLKGEPYTLVSIVDVTYEDLTQYFGSEKYPISMNNYLFDENMKILSEQNFRILEHFVYRGKGLEYSYISEIDGRIGELGGEGSINFRLIKNGGFEMDIVKRK